ncbi:glycoside hydrolase family 15 protein [Halobaculum sp. MBLA0147]|uniref:glycoside hydrolase family 15 protein n=1 Tax=Halobaculum sp. MBLA0147 TaxID=3079934 RepID=UPI00352419AC
MSLRHALDDVKRTRGDDRVFPGEFRTPTGRFSGTGDRLVHVAPDGRTRDYSYPLSGLAGVERSRFGIVFHDDGEIDGGSDADDDGPHTDDDESDADAETEPVPLADATVHWFADGDQRYVLPDADVDGDGSTDRDDGADAAGDTFGAGPEDTGAAPGSTVIETTYHVAGHTVRRRDYTDGRCHRTRFETDVPATVYGYVEFTPDRVESRRSLLHHGDAVEAYHRTEHDYLAVAADATRLTGEIPPTLGDALSPEPTEYPTDRPGGAYEDRSLTGGIVLVARADDGTAGVVTLPTEAAETPREAALSRVRDAAETTRETGVATAVTGAVVPPGGHTPTTDDDGLARVLAQDRRVLRLLTAPGGGRIAGPDFDPFYASSGGYGYTWFRDDAEIARFLLATDDRVADDLDEWHERAAAFYAGTQAADGSWPHRVWPDDGALAPGWANARLEAGDDGDYQADQTASVVAFLATYLRTGDPADPERVRDTLADAVPALEDTLAADGLPVRCQNAWENMQGRFSHTAFTFLHAFAALSRVTDDPGLAARVDDLEARVDRSLSALTTGVERLWLPEAERYALRLEGPAPTGGDAGSGADAAEAATDHAADGGAVTAAADADPAALVSERAADADPRADAASLAAAGAYAELHAAGYDLSEARLDRLVAHVDNTLAALYRETDAVRGLARFDGDPWRRKTQAEPKVWTVSTAWGAHASATLGSLLGDLGDDRADARDAQARTLLGELLPGGSLLDDGGYLPEQVFDDGCADCARPLGWPHALRTATATELAERDALRGPGELVGGE